MSLYLLQFYRFGSRFKPPPSSLPLFFRGLRTPAGARRASFPQSCTAFLPSVAEVDGFVALSPRFLNLDHAFFHMFKPPLIPLTFFLDLFPWTLFVPRFGDFLCFFCSTPHRQNAWELFFVPRHRHSVFPFFSGSHFSLRNMFPSIGSFLILRRPPVLPDVRWLKSPDDLSVQRSPRCSIPSVFPSSFVFA